MAHTKNRSQPASGGGNGNKPAAADRAALGLAVLALLVAALNLRPAIAAVSPLVGSIRSDLGLSATGVALLTTIPVLAMGLCAPVAAAVGRRWGLQRGVLLGLAIIGVGTLARAGGESTWLQFSSAAVAGVGIAIAQTLMPAVVKARFVSRAGLMTGIYTTGLGLGAIVAAGASVPLADVFESWPAALASWSVLALAGIVMWSVAGRALDLGSASAPKGPATSGLPWRSAMAWRITALSAVNSALYYVELAWVAPLLIGDGGLSASRAGVSLTIMLAIQVVFMLATPVLLGERRDPRVGLTVTALMTAAGFLGLAFSPESAIWLWLIFLGIGHGGLFTLVLALPAVASRDTIQAGRFSGLAFLVGYVCAAVAPLIVGALHDTSGNFHLAFGLLGIVAVLMMLPIAQLSPRRLDREHQQPPPVN